MNCQLHPFSGKTTYRDRKLSTIVVCRFKRRYTRKQEKSFSSKINVCKIDYSKKKKNTLVYRFRLTGWKFKHNARFKRTERSKPIFLASVRRLSSYETVFVRSNIYFFGARDFVVRMRRVRSPNSTWCYYTIQIIGTREKEFSFYFLRLYSLAFIVKSE